MDELKQSKETPFMATSISSFDETDSKLQRQNLLVAKLIGDIGVACGITFCIAPCISIIDKSVVQRAAGTHTVLQSCAQSMKEMIRNPRNFVKSPMFLMMWGVYASTYITGEDIIFRDFWFIFLYHLFFLIVL